MRAAAFAAVIFSLAGAGASAQSAARVSIPAGAFQPMFGSEGKDLPVQAFSIDQRAVTNEEFARFVKAAPVWRKAKVASEAADENYLMQWQGREKSAPAKADKRNPVTNISWFAALAYCEKQGGRLPTTLEWEYVAAASKEERDASKNQKFQEKILLWYAERGHPTEKQALEANFYGLEGLHGLVWEWTSDFNAFFVAADNRQDGDQSKNFFCGAGATGAANREGYAAFMRYALRSSLQATFTLNSLGFRCAYDQ